jgi:biopolymer transport protein ExbD
MQFKKSQSRVIIPIVEMTPMIDIVFLLIIFFMVAAQFAQQARVQLDLPQEKGEQLEKKPKNMLVINILDDGTYVLNVDDGAVSLEEVSAVLQEAIYEDDVLWNNISIRADKNVEARALNEVLVILSNYGLSAANIATETK